MNGDLVRHDDGRHPGCWSAPTKIHAVGLGVLGGLLSRSCLVAHAAEQPTRAASAKPESMYLCRCIGTSWYLMYPHCFLDVTARKGSLGCRGTVILLRSPLQYYYQVCQSEALAPSSNDGKRERASERRHQDIAVQPAERANISFSSSLPQLPPHYTLPQFSSHSINALPCHSHLPRPHHHHSFFSLVSIPASQLSFGPSKSHTQAWFLLPGCRY